MRFERKVLVIIGMMLGRCGWRVLFGIMFMQESQQGFTCIILMMFYVMMDQYRQL
ncbi:hypothetical protein GWC95_19030 [Sediminibacterium roseum]|uniref:Uncharacterized protein n=1 Tax=Sediminibacterium roseum TaxID=1978412 RepID=A0ABX0A4C3_9BACT|nr:hypothetical protein [Sediminibacterium roseum]NCI52026.1 hypothetical protein [Sediminibacterium roseum]